MSDFEAVKASLAEAVALRGEARTAWLERLRVEDAELHDEVVSLLAHEDSHAMTSAMDALPGRLTAALQGPAPDAIGPYEVLGELGSGGMGVVYRGRQTQPLRRDVAVKVLGRAALGAVGRARFDVEARALARLDHPHVAAVYDAGVDQRGLPYLVLQLVDGIPLDEAAVGLSLRQRLDMFLAVCDAVGHAHQRGVVHRDLKPSNVLVGEQSGRPWPVVIDFGIAQDTQAESAVLTQVGQRIGTPAYMSPEQAGAFDGIVDTRTDVYALGLMLFELLTSRRAFDHTNAEAVRAAASLAPPRPSAHAGPISASALTGDLDTIVAMALRPEPARRYPSVAALADDVRRHLDQRPVLARGDSWAYVASRFVGRHRVAVGLAGVVALGLLVAVGVAVAQDLRVRAQRDRAVAAEQRAVAEAETARQVSDFLVELFEEADPTVADGVEVTVRELLDRGTEQIEALDAQPLVQATLLHTLSRSYHGLGEHEAARALGERALALREEHAPGSLELMKALELLATVHHDAGDFEASAEAAERALELARAVGGPGEVSGVANGLAVTLDAVGQHERAEVLYREALETYRDAHGDDDPEVAWLINTLAQCRWRLGHYQEAASMLQDADARVRRLLGDDHVDRGYVLNNLAHAHWVLGRHAEAEVAWRDALTIFERVFGPDHAAVGRGTSNLSKVVLDRGRVEEAYELADRGVRVLRAALGDHRLTSAALVARARVAIALGKLDDAARDAALARTMAADDFGPEHRLARTARRVLAEVAARRDQLPEAIEALRELAQLADEHDGADHPYPAQIRLSLAERLREAGDCAAAAALAGAALPVLSNALGADHEVTRRAHTITRECAAE